MIAQTVFVSTSARCLRLCYVMLCYVAGIFEGTECQIGLLGLAISYICGGQRLLFEIGFEDFQLSTKFCIHKTGKKLFGAGG